MSGCGTLVLGAFAFIVVLWVMGSCGGGSATPGKNYSEIECENLRITALSNSSHSEDALVQYDAYC